MRLSRNLAYMCAQHAPDKEGCTFEKFKIAGRASFEHHWNNHEFCGDWCQAKGWSEEEKLKYKHKYRNKETHAREYAQQLIIVLKFTEDGRLARVYHLWLNNKTESIHGLIVNIYLPKRSYFCQTICGKARTFLAVSIGLLGYYEYYKILYLKIGIIMSSITALYYQQHGKKRKADRIYFNKPAVRRKRAQQRLDNINAEWKREVVDKQNGNTYRSRMAGPKVSTGQKRTAADQNASGEGTTSTGKKRPFCKKCQNYGHHRIFAGFYDLRCYNFLVKS
jgi:hypothetical protein